MHSYLVGLRQYSAKPYPYRWFTNVIWLTVLCSSLAPAMGLAPLTAQSIGPALIQFTTDDGLPSSETYDIIQDRAGYIWIGTDNGVSRYDGYTFRNYGRKEGLEDKTVFKLFEDHRGWIWMATFSGKLYVYREGRIRPYEYNHLILQYRTFFYSIVDFFVDSAGSLHISLLSYGIIRIDPDGEHRVWAEDLPTQSGYYKHDGRYLPFYWVHPIYHLRKDSLYNAGKKDYYYLTVIDEGQVNVRSIPISDPPQTWRAPLNQNSLLTLRKGVLLRLGRIMMLLPEDNQAPPSNALTKPEMMFYSAKQFPDGSIFAGHQKSIGVCWYSSLRAFLAQDAYRSFLQGNIIAAILQDRDGGVWFATNNQGIFYTPDRQYTVYDQTSGLSTDYALSLALTSPDGGIVGLKNGDMYTFSLQHGLTPHSTDINELEVNTIYYDQYHKSLLRGSSLYEYRAQQWEFIEYNVLKSIPGNYQSVKKIVPSLTTDSLWMVTHESRVELLTYQNDRYVITDYFDNPYTTKIYSVLHDRPDHLWVGTMQGLYELDLATRKFIPAHHFPVFEDRIQDIRQLTDGTLVIGTRTYGVVLWKGDRLRLIDQQAGMTSNSVTYMHIDSLQRIWVGTQEGLNLLQQHANDSVSVSTYTRANGLPGNEIKMIDSWGDNVWVATSNGLVLLPTELQTQNNALPAVIDRIKVNNKVVDRDYMVRLKPEERSIQVDFLTFDYRNRDDITYRYRLRPQDTWTTTTSRSINLVSLEAATYQLEVQTSARNAIWSDSTLLPFTIPLPVWRRWWFLALVVFSIGGILYLFLRNRIRQLKEEKRRIQLENEVVELKQLAYRAQMNPHFIFNCLNSIQGFILGDRAEKDKAVRYLAKFSHLVRQALEATQVSRVTLAEDLQILTNYLDLELMRFDHTFTYSISLGAAVHPSRVMVVPMLVQPYVENAILHGLAERLPDGQIELSYTLEDERLRIDITDNGIGVTASLQRKEEQNTHSTHQSLGMDITRRRLQMLHKNGQSGSVQIKDIVDENGHVKGTRVTLYLPLVWDNHP